MPQYITSLVLFVCLVDCVRADPPFLQTPPSDHSVVQTKSTLPVRPVLTAEDCQKVNAARTAALKANPDLGKQAQELEMKIRAFQDKLDAAMIREDPRIAPMLNQSDHRPTPPAPNASSSQVSLPARSPTPPTK